MMTFADTVLSLLPNLRIGKALPDGVGVLNPYRDPAVMKLCEIFYRRYYDDTHTRRILVGINPGRFGAGITGIPFTDPLKLAQICGIANDLGTRSELSADFIYRVVAALGGPGAFYARFYITSVSPLGFTQMDKNLNYYDRRDLQEAITPFAVRSMERLLNAPVDRSVCYCIGEGSNYRFLYALNAKRKWFASVVPLAHPRFIMQYRRKQVERYVDDYVTKLTIG